MITNIRIVTSAYSCEFIIQVVKWFRQRSQKSAEKGRNEEPVKSKHGSLSCNVTKDLFIWHKRVLTSLKNGSKNPSSYNFTVLLVLCLLAGYHSFHTFPLAHSHSLANVSSTALNRLWMHFSCKIQWSIIIHSYSIVFTLDFLHIFQFFRYFIIIQ